MYETAERVGLLAMRRYGEEPRSFERDPGFLSSCASVVCRGDSERERLVDMVDTDVDE